MGHTVRHRRNVVNVVDFQGQNRGRLTERVQDARPVDVERLPRARDPKPPLIPDRIEHEHGARRCLECLLDSVDLFSEKNVCHSCGFIGRTQSKTLERLRLAKLQAELFGDTFFRGASFRAGHRRIKTRSHGSSHCGLAHAPSLSGVSSFFSATGAAGAGLLGIVGAGGTSGGSSSRSSVGLSR